MMFFSSAPADGAASGRRAKKAGVVVAWALVLFAVYGNHGMFSRSDSSKSSSVGPSMSQRRSETDYLFEGLLPKYVEDDGRVGSVIPSQAFLASQNFTGEQGHCRGAKAGKSCCGPRGSGSFILPLFPNQELAWPRWFRGLLYLICLLWVFMGVSILCDAFMNGIETITAQTYIKKVKLWNKDKTPKMGPDGQQLTTSMEAEVWNPSVANLTLMALGSSTPEILLSVIETCASGFYSGDLGPGTIVGSAAFNLFIITGLCIGALPDGETKGIERYGVFLLTAFHSLLAYAWLVIIVTVNSADVIDLWEAVVTLLFMPWMCVWVYCADKNWFRDDLRVYADDIEEGAGEGGLSKMRDDSDATVPAGPGQNNTTANEDTPANDNRAPNSTPRIQHSSFEASGGVSDRGVLVDDEGRKVTRLRPKENMSVAQRKRQVMSSMTAPQSAVKSMVVVDHTVSRVTFATPKVSVLENVGNASIPVKRTGPVDFAMKVAYKCIDGTAKDKDDYTAVSGLLEFGAGEEECIIKVPIVDDSTQWNAEKNFEIVLELTAECNNQTAKEIKLGQIPSTTVGIIDVDNPGEFCFTEIAFACLSTDSKIALSVERRSGATGIATVTVVPKSASAKSGVHFKGEEHVITFQQDQAAALVQIPLIPDGWKDVDSESIQSLRFFVDLAKPTPVDGAKLTTPHHAEVLIRFNEEEHELGEDESWGGQFALALAVENPAEASASDLFIHYISIMWKLAAATIPPANQQIFGRDSGGWLTFVFAIGWIGIVTTIINDLASIFGCIVGLEDSITAITLVALGTSLPDTIASMMSARADTNADNSIGNVTGSNSVNVFLGIGLPWTMAAAYWEAMGQTEAWKAKYATWLLTPAAAALRADPSKGAFIVIGGDLAFYTTIFVILAISVLGLLIVRRYTCGGELGGNVLIARVCTVFCISCWFIYVIVSILKVVMPDQIQGF